MVIEKVKARKNPEGKECFGMHLTLDLYGCNERKICDKKTIHKILNELPDLIDMHKISEPFVEFFEGSPTGNPNSFDKGGICGFVLIAESHISIHTFSGYGYASVDVFSCKPFDADLAERFFVKQLEAKKVERRLFNRGLEFPKCMEASAQIVRKSRPVLAAPIR
jgi:S-adenosylmethionine decarboxylase